MLCCLQGIICHCEKTHLLVTVLPLITIIYYFKTRETKTGNMTKRLEIIVLALI